MTVTPENKHVVLFWLGRHLRELEARTAEPDHVGMAAAGMGYGQRQVVLGAIEAAADAQRVQIDSVKAAIKYIEENCR